MKSLVKNLMIAGVMATAAGSMAVAQTSNSQFEQWYRAKYGRPAPVGGARMGEEQAKTAYREVTVTQAAAPANTWFEGWYRAKYGRPSPTEQARIDAELAGIAYREVPSTEAQKPGSAWYDGWYRAKFGRPSPTEVASTATGQENTACEKTPRQVAAPANTENRRMFLDARAPDLPPRYSASEIKEMIHDAKAPDDFRRLADYFDFRAMDFEQKAEVQLSELQRLLALRYHARSYATQVDNTRELIKRYKAQAQECSARATAYRAQSTLNTETR